MQKRKVLSGGRSLLVRVLDLLEPGDLRLVIKRVAVVKFPMLVLLLLPT